ncbi:PucR family transcriptional regulator [Actinomadura terrae]|uniref:PucR family transcriptional regulator n=1 Tax=Actinomadura terrae TaxID=604353 RepID=UPI001FA7BF3D|nr:helix-turn-helix domain-containing protein [Actinomadura terrae]
MGDLFKLLESRVGANARRAVEIYAREVPEFRAVAADASAREALVEFSVLLRRRTVELAVDEMPLSSDDLAAIAAAGRERALAGMSLKAHDHVLGLHSALAVQELHEAAGPGEADALMRLLGWLGPQGTAAKDAYTHGFLDGQRNVLTFAHRVQQLAEALLTGDPVASGLAEVLGLPLAAGYTVTVVRIAGRGPDTPAAERQKIVGALTAEHRVPLRWREPLEVVALVPGDTAQARVRRSALDFARAVAGAVGRPCAVGASSARRHALPDALAMARRIAEAAPLRAVPREVSTLQDVFVELGAGRLPEVERWLRQVAQQLARGPDLVTTLDAYYRHDMNRLATASHLHIHPRTVDYRLHRARELTGIAPATAHGVRVLTAAVARVLAVNP